ncbi:GMC oxidoreductase [Ganoderma leucocontextum]|nr:GMC oxidoreductase [Ganoderma leucocontextum]
MDHKLAKISDVADNTFDFVIVGGGVAGCALAVRLSENPNLTVALLEAGNAHIDDPLITTPDGWMRQLFNPEYDWVYRTVPQKNSKNAVTTPDGAPDPSFYWTRGKGLGGSSGINFLMWTRPQREEIDAIEALGNEGWNWARYFEASKKSESFHPTVRTNDSEYADKYKEESVGSNGPLPISFTRTVSGAESRFQKALSAFGVDVIDDGLNGAHAGTFKSVSNIEASTGTRSTAATGYLFPALDRPNLKVLTGAHVRRLLTTKQTEGVVATGAEFGHGEQVYAVNASKEVILCAGTVKSPHILELSGIGNRATLESANIPVQVDLPTVGENLQDHIIFCGNMWQMKDGHNFVTSDTLPVPDLQAKLREIYGGIGGPVSLATTGVTFLPIKAVSDRAAELIETAERDIASKADKLPAGLKEQYDAQLALYKSADVPSVEFIVFPFNPHPNGQAVPLVGLFSILSHPFSRGSIHATTADPAVEPAIDPNYLGEQVDFEILLDAVKFSLKVAGTAPWQDAAERELFPGAAGATEESLRDFVRNFISTVWHACGTCSMLPQDKGGVVDASLKVYGTTNIRVADLSTLPLITAAHTQTTVYAIAEQAADIIKKKYGF